MSDARVQAGPAARGLEHCALSIDVRSPRLPLGRAHLLASTVLREARRAGVPADSIVSVGSLRRYAPDVGGVSLLAVADSSRNADVLNGFAALPLVSGVQSQTSRTIAVTTSRGPISVHVVTPAQRGAAMIWHTGSRPHIEQLAVRATRFGFRFSEGELVHSRRGSVDAASEPVVYRHLGLPFIAPELREGNGEIEAAERGALPELVSDMHIRGDLHMHSTWSDGRDSIAAMVSAAQQIGYEYVAITDHSQNAFSSRRLSLDDVARQREEISVLRARMPDIVILHGVEVDILKDGSLDFADEILEGFDIVLASLHDHGGQPPAELTARYLQSIAHPLVNVITHPANRTPALAAGYDLDFDALFAAAADTGTAMEIDGAPGHLDMDGSVAKRAVRAGVIVSIDSDCHRADALARQMRFGLGTARRGWVAPHQVLNTRSIDQVRAFIAAKRARA
jgi:DNA polymerase (family 10)